MASVAHCEPLELDLPCELGIGKGKIGEFAVGNLHPDARNKVAEVANAFICQHALVAAKFNRRLHVNAVIARGEFYVVIVTAKVHIIVCKGIRLDGPHSVEIDLIYALEPAVLDGIGNLGWFSLEQVTVVCIFYLHYCA